MNMIFDHTNSMDIQSTVIVDSKQIIDCIITSSQNESQEVPTIEDKRGYVPDVVPMELPLVESAFLSRSYNENSDVPSNDNDKATNNAEGNTVSTNSNNISSESQPTIVKIPEKRKTLEPKTTVDSVEPNEIIENEEHDDFGEFQVIDATEAKNEAEPDNIEFKDSDGDFGYFQTMESDLDNFQAVNGVSDNPTLNETHAKEQPVDSNNVISSDTDKMETQIDTSKKKISTTASVEFPVFAQQDITKTEPNCTTDNGFHNFGEFQETNSSMNINKPDDADKMETNADTLDNEKSTIAPVDFDIFAQEDVTKAEEPAGNTDDNFNAFGQFQETSSSLNVNQPVNADKMGTNADEFENIKSTVTPIGFTAFAQQDTSNTEPNSAADDDFHAFGEFQETPSSLDRNHSDIKQSPAEVTSNGNIGFFGAIELNSTEIGNNNDIKNLKEETTNIEIHNNMENNINENKGVEFDAFGSPPGSSTNTFQSTMEETNYNYEGKFFEQSKSDMFYDPTEGSVPSVGPVPSLSALDNNSGNQIRNVEEDEEFGDFGDFQDPTIHIMNDSEHNEEAAKECVNDDVFASMQQNTDNPPKSNSLQTTDISNTLGDIEVTEKRDVLNQQVALSMFDHQDPLDGVVSDLQDSGSANAKPNEESMNNPGYGNTLKVDLPIGGFSFSPLQSNTAQSNQNDHIMSSKNRNESMDVFESLQPDAMKCYNTAPSEVSGLAQAFEKPSISIPDEIDNNQLPHAHEGVSSDNLERGKNEAESDNEFREFHVSNLPAPFHSNQEKVNSDIAILTSQPLPSMMPSSEPPTLPPEPPSEPPTLPPEPPIAPPESSILPPITPTEPPTMAPTPVSATLSTTAALTTSSITPIEPQTPTLGITNMKLDAKSDPFSTLDPKDSDDDFGDFHDSSVQIEPANNMPNTANFQQNNIHDPTLPTSMSHFDVNDKTSTTKASEFHMYSQSTPENVNISATPSINEMNINVGHHQQPQNLGFNNEILTQTSTDDDFGDFQTVPENSIDNTIKPAVNNSNADQTNSNTMIVNNLNSFNVNTDMSSNMMEMSMNMSSNVMTLNSNTVNMNHNLNLMSNANMNNGNTMTMDNTNMNPNVMNMMNQNMNPMMGNTSTTVHSDNNVMGSGSKNDAISDAFSIFD